MDFELLFNVLFVEEDGAVKNCLKQWAFLMKMQLLFIRWCFGKKDLLLYPTDERKLQLNLKSLEINSGFKTE